MKRCAIYVRVSTQEQKNHGLSVDSQIHALEQYCAEHNMKLVDVYNDAGFSASKSYKKRPEVLRLINDCNEGKIDIILFTKLDRWFRSVKDYYGVMSAIPDSVTWKAIWEDYETETSAGRFKVNIMLSIAQAEAERTSERIKAVNQYKREQGHYVGGKPPTGYRIHKDKLLYNEETYEGVKAFFQALLDTYNVRKGVDAMRKHGMNTTRETAIRMIKNRAYSGTASGGYKCPAYITEEQQDDLIQKICVSPERHHHNPNPNIYIFGGIVICPKCGGVCSGKTRTMHSGGKVYFGKWYGCNRSRNLTCDNSISLSEKKMEKAVLSMLEPKLNEYIMSFEVAHEDDHTDDIARLESKLRRIGDRYEDGDISRDEYRMKRDAIKKEMNELKSLNKKKIPTTLPYNWREMYDTLSVDNKKIWWKSVVTNLTLLDGKVDIIF